MKLFIKVISCVLAALLFVLPLCSCDGKGDDTSTQSTHNRPLMNEFPWTFANEGIEVVDIGQYRGAFLEDGSDTLINNVLMIIVHNPTDKPLQYAEITLFAGDDLAYFDVSTLPAGESAVVLERNMLPYEEDYRYLLKNMQTAYFTDGVCTLHEDVFEITGDNSQLSVKNISEKDVDGTVKIYYKTFKDGYYYGGITYNVSIDSLASGQTKTVPAGHFIKDYSQLMFVTYLNE